MPRPRKYTILCRKLAADPSARAHSRRTASDTVDAGCSGSESDRDVELLVDDFSGREISTKTVKTILVWKEGAGSTLRSNYTGNSRRTFYRRENEKKQHIDSIKGDPKIWTYSQK